MNVLWGRVVVLGVVLLLVFLLGRATSGSSAEIQDLQERLEDREAEIDQLEAANREAANATPTESAPVDGTVDGTTGGTTTTTATPTPTVTTTASPSPAANTEAQTYTVKSGDNLGRISTRFYGTAGLARCIQDANDITDASTIQVGKSLTIPAKASCTATGTTATPTASASP
jgi:nucleoid-associated protein YgaU